MLSTPNGRRLDRVMEQLEFVVAVDLYVNETTRYAHVLNGVPLRLRRVPSQSGERAA